MTCPLGPNKSMKDAICIADKLKKITEADIIENLHVSGIADYPTYSTYKLTMKLYESKDYRNYTDVTVEDWEETLKVVFVRELEDAIQKHVRLLSKTSDIKNFVDQTNKDDDDGGGFEDTEGYEDLGLDAQKRKLQGTNGVDYEDKDEVYYEEEDLEETYDGELSDKPEKIKSKSSKKKTDRSFFVNLEGMHFEIHFKFTDKTHHVLLAQVISTATQFLFSRQTA